MLSPLASIPHLPYTTTLHHDSLTPPRITCMHSLFDPSSETRIFVTSLCNWLRFWLGGTCHRVPIRPISRAHPGRPTSGWLGGRICSRLHRRDSGLCSHAIHLTVHNNSRCLVFSLFSPLRQPTPHSSFPLLSLPTQKPIPRQHGDPQPRSPPLKLQGPHPVLRRRGKNLAHFPLFPPSDSSIALVVRVGPSRKDSP